MHSLLSQEDLAFKAHCEAFASQTLAPLAKKLGDINDVPQELRTCLAESGLYGPLFPEAYGGTGLSAVRICLAREAIAGVYAPADTTLAMQGLGGYPIVLAGNEDQKKKYLPKLAAGQRLTTFCLTEPEAGSDVSAIQTRAVADGDHFVINGRKRFISNGFSADMGVVFVKTPTAEKPNALSAFIIEKGMPGWNVDWRIELMASHDIVEFEFNNLRVPKENLLGPVGGGFKLAMQTLDLMRMSVGAAALGMARTAMERSIQYARKRVQFGQQISKFQGVSFKLAEMAVDIEAAQCLVYLAAIKKDRSDPAASLSSSIAKLHATEAAFRCIDQAIQVHGGMGVVKGAVVERLYREIRPLRVYEGTTEIQKLIIANHLIKQPK
ncbi:acyl-CoA dehydrogenase family protein [Desulfatitalea tepidiphila]|uniref:acyl-CoA dehydrogenase family protein n=1 Tax=Desulfatitalea tepidiphila TaxID=1185843 RepID=UPI000978A9EB|nr:acyl-CoA dehydrogenase family protein [Desulfatitalea tepidiphila]